MVHAGRKLVAVVLCVAASWAGSFVHAESASGIMFRARPIMGSGARASGILPVRVDLRTMGPFTGSIAVQMDGVPEANTVLPVNVGPGVFRYEIPAVVSQQPAGDGVTVLLQDRVGRIVRHQEFQIHFSGFMSNYRGGHPAMVVGFVGRKQERVRERYGYGMNVSGLISTAGIAVEDLPEDPRMYEAIDCLVLPSCFARLSEQQADALLAWVRSGGRLVLDSSGEALDVDKNILFKRLGIKVGETRDIVSFEQKVSTRDRRHGNMVSRVMTNQVPARRISAGSVQSAGKDSMRGDMPTGLGCVTITCLDLNSLLSSDRDDEAVDQMIEDIITGEKRSGKADQDYYYDYYGQTGPPWTRSLFLMSALEPIPVWLITVYLLLFIVLVCPVERIVLGRFRMLRWTWVVTTVLAAIFCVFAGMLSRAARGTKARRAMMCVHNYGLDGSGKHILYDCFIPSTARSFTALCGPEDLIMDVSTRGSGSRAVLNAARNTMEFSSPVWSPHFLVTIRPHDDPAPFKTSIELVDGKPAGRVDGPEGLQIQNAWLSWSGLTYGMTNDGTGWKVQSPVLVPEGDQNQWDVSRRAPRRKTPDVEKELVNAILWFDRAGETGKSRLNLSPAPLPRPVINTNSAVLMAVCSGGEALDVDVKQAKVDALHIVRQVVKVSKPDGK